MALPENAAPRVLIVTGGSRGIGAATARLAGAAGYRVCVDYHGDEKAASAVVDAIVLAGGDAFACRADTSDETDVRRLFATTAERFGGVTDLVNNAGLLGGDCRVETLDRAVLTRLFEVNVFGYFLCCREAVRYMSIRHGHRGGRIVNVSSIAASHGSAGRRVHYAASKAAVNALTVGFGEEVAAEGIRVNAFSPGVTATAMNPPERIARVATEIPLRRAATPEEMAGGILWLLSDAAAYCTASNLTMSGGRR